jgi:hypothetical protein
LFFRNALARLIGILCCVGGYTVCAERVMAVLPQRLQRYGLTLHPDKTRLLDFRPPPVGQRGGKGPATFDFLGFTL